MVSRRDCWNVTLPARIPLRTDRVQIAMEKVTKSSANHLMRLNGTPDFETDRTTLLQHAYLYRAMYKFSMCTVSLSAEAFPYMLCYPAEEPLYLMSDRSGECSKEWRSNQHGSRNASKFGGHNIFPMGPEVVVRPARPPSLDCPNIDHLTPRKFISSLVSYRSDASLTYGWLRDFLYQELVISSRACRRNATK
jgi:hypothetical protein